MKELKATLIRWISPDFNHGQAGLHEAANVLADLSVGLGRLSEVVPHLLVGFVQHPPLLVRRAPRRTAAGRNNDILDLETTKGGR